MVATAFGDTVSVVSGGLACVVGALVVARLLPGFRHERSTVGTLGTRGSSLLLARLLWRLSAAGLRNTILKYIRPTEFRNLTLPRRERS